MISLVEQAIYLPRISQQVEHCQLIEWRKEEGDTVKAGETLLVYETQKASSVFEAPASGILKKIFIPSGEWLTIMEPVGIITIKNSI